MTYQQATRLRNDLLGMVGESNASRIINDVVLAPVDDTQFTSWENEYKTTEDGVNAIIPYIDFDIKVIFIYNINGRSFKVTGLFMYQNVLSASKDFGVEIDLDKYKN